MLPAACITEVQYKFKVMSACKMLTSKNMIRFFKYSQRPNFHHLLSVVTGVFTNCVCFLFQAEGFEADVGRC